jgi:hypothetical protein
MAKAAWLSVDPSSGSGNSSVNVEGLEFTGRVQRQSILTFKATGVSNETVDVYQAGKPVFITVNNLSIAKTGGSFTITGKSNGNIISFGGTNPLPFDLEMPSSIIVAGSTINYDPAYAGAPFYANLSVTDPGATAEYDFSITFIGLPENNTTSPIESFLVVGGQSSSAMATLTQAAADPSLSVAPTSITLPWKGEPAESVSVTSNTNWTVE